MRRNKLTTGGVVRPGRRAGRRIPTTVMVALLFALSLASPVAADEYDSSKSGHPLRIVAYVLHPVGVALDFLLVQPAHWLVSREPFKTAFGHED